MQDSNQSKNYERFTAPIMVEIAAPHTWAASILPVIVATALAAVTNPPLSPLMIFVLVCITILMQSSVNSFNDYYDFVKGNDSIEDCPDPHDAALIYHQINPKSVLRFAIALLVLAFVLGIYVILIAGIIPLVIGLIGAFFVVVYSAGKLPISYLPIGELVSGFVMGGLITLASYQALTLEFSWWALLWAIPLICGIGLIMFTNNTCDIEKDMEAKRNTLAVCLGRDKARKVYHAILLIWIASIILLIGIFFVKGLILMPFMLLLAYPQFNAIWTNPLNIETRMSALPQILGLNITLGLFYAASIYASAALVLI
ncbi:MAG: prenyltransferase [Eggerthellaceae bacterium]